MATITQIETCAVPPRWLFVRLECDDGSVGWGEASLEGHGEAVAGAFAALAMGLNGLITALSLPWIMPWVERLFLR